jgi:hypothetical protein
MSYTDDYLPLLEVLHPQHYSRCQEIGSVRLRTAFFHNGVTSKTHVHARVGASRHRTPIGLPFEPTDSGNEAIATIALPHRSRGERSPLSALRYGRLLRGRKWAFSQSNSGVITTYTLKLGAAGDGDNRGHSLSAFQAVCRSIHGILPNFTANAVSSNLARRSAHRDRNLLAQPGYLLFVGCRQIGR